MTDAQTLAWIEQLELVFPSNTRALLKRELTIGCLPEPILERLAGQGQLTCKALGCFEFAGGQNRLYYVVNGGVIWLWVDTNGRLKRMRLAEGMDAYGLIRGVGPQNDASSGIQTRRALSYGEAHLYVGTRGWSIVKEHVRSGEPEPVLEFTIEEGQSTRRVAFTLMDGGENRALDYFGEGQTELLDPGRLILFVSKVVKARSGGLVPVALRALTWLLAQIPASGHAIPDGCLQHPIDRWMADNTPARFQQTTLVELQNALRQIQS